MIEVKPLKFLFLRSDERGRDPSRLIATRASSPLARPAGHPQRPPREEDQGEVQRGRHRRRPEEAGGRTDRHARPAHAQPPASLVRLRAQPPSHARPQAPDPKRSGSRSGTPSTRTTSPWPTTRSTTAWAWSSTTTERASRARAWQQGTARVPQQPPAVRPPQNSAGSVPAARARAAPPQPPLVPAAHRHRQPGLQEQRRRSQPRIVVVAAKTLLDALRCAACQLPGKQLPSLGQAWQQVGQ